MKKILLTTNHPAPYINRWIDVFKSAFDVEVIYYTYEERYKAWKQFSPFPGELFKQLGVSGLYKTLKDKDLIIGGGYNSLYYIYLVILCRLLHKRIHLYSDYPAQTRKSRLLFFFKKAIFTHLFDGILCATQSTKEFYHSTYGIRENRLWVLPYMSMSNEECISDNYNRERQSQLDRGECLRIFVANSFYKRKGYNTLFESLARLSHEGLLESVDIKIAGIGEELDLYKAKSETLNAHIDFLGWIETEDYARQMAWTDVVVHASDFEPFGIPPVDAMKNGKVLIASKGVKSIECVVCNGENGFLFEPKDSAMLYECLKHVISNKQNIYDIGRKARIDINKIYSERAILNNMLRMMG